MERVTRQEEAGRQALSLSLWHGTQERPELKGVAGRARGTVTERGEEKARAGARKTTNQLIGSHGQRMQERGPKGKFKGLPNLRIE